MINKANHSLSKLLVAVLVLLALSCSKEDECRPATTANAGIDQDVVGTSTALEGNTPESGTGTWTLVTPGTDGVIENPLNPASAFSGSVGNTYVLKWNIKGCPASEDEVSITFSCDPALAADAGDDQSLNDVITTLDANGAGTWTILSGDGGTVAQPTNAASSFTGVAGTTYTLRWTVACPASQDDVQITFTNNPEFLTVDKTSVINGEIITLTGKNFTSNYQGGSQVNAIKLADPSMGQEVYLPILSRTATEMKAVMIGAGGGMAGEYNLRYNKKPDGGAATLFPSELDVTINAAAPGQFFTSSSFTSNNVSKGSEVSFGAKNGSTVAADYTIKLIHYDYSTGVATEYDVTNVTVTADGYGGTMDKVAFTIPADLPTSEGHHMKVTYDGATVMGGWGSYLNVLP